MKVSPTKETISLKYACMLLDDASAVIINDTALTYPAVETLTDEPDNEFFYVSWTDDAGYEYKVTAVEENNQEVLIENGSLIFIDNEGESFKVTLLNVFRAKGDKS